MKVGFIGLGHMGQAMALPSGDVWRNRLIGALPHGEGDHDWAVMTKDRWRTSGLA